MLVKVTCNHCRGISEFEIDTLDDLSDDNTICPICGSNNTETTVETDLF